MNDEEIRKAASEAFWSHSGDADEAAEAVYRAGMEAGRAEASKRSGRISGAENAGDMAAFLRRLESDPEEAARFLGAADTRGLLKAKPKRQKAPACAVERPVDVQEQTWEDWLTLRRTKKAAVTKTVMNAAKIEAVKAGLTLEGFLRVWCYRGSQGLEAAWITQSDRAKLAAGRMDRQLETAALMTGAARQAPTDMGEIYDVGQQRIASR